MPGNIHSPTPKLKDGTFVLDPHFLESSHTPHPLEFHTVTIRGQWRIQGKGPGGPSSLLLDQMRPEGPKKIFLSPPPPLSQGLDDRPAPRRLSEGLDPALGLSISTDGRQNTSATLLTEVD